MQNYSIAIDEFNYIFMFLSKYCLGHACVSWRNFPIWNFNFFCMVSRTWSLATGKSLSSSKTHDCLLL